MVEIINYVKGSPVAVMVPKYSTMTSHMANEYKAQKQLSAWEKFN